MIAAQCYIIDMDHGTKSSELIRNQENNVAPISIGDDVWIAAGCKILKSLVIHNGAIIGAMNLVKGQVSENGITVEIPAKLIRIRK